MIKFKDKTRIKVSGYLKTELGLNFWDNKNFHYIMDFDYGLHFTSKRIMIHYFKVVDEKKFMLFSLKYPEFIIRK